MAIMHQERLSLGKFLYIIFDSQNRKEALLLSARQKVDSFLKGNTEQGTQPVDIVRLIVEHNFGRDKEKRDQPTYHPLPSFTSHPHPGGLLVSTNPIQVLSFYERQDFAGESLRLDQMCPAWQWSVKMPLRGQGVVEATTRGIPGCLGQDKKATLKALGHMLVAREIQIHLLYDNINQYHRAWRANLTSQNRLESGTAATLIVQRKIDGHKNAFNGPDKEPITFKRLKADVNPLHLEDVAITNILWIFLKFIPHLQKFKNDVDNLQYVKHAKCHMKLQKTKYHLLECSGYNEASTQGNCDVVLDAFIRQLGLSRNELEGRQFPVSGDQATVARLRTLLEQTSLCRSWFTTHKWVLPVIELWHLKWAFLKGIFKAHWACKVGKGDVGLCTAAEALGWNINPDKVEFYPCYRLAELVLTTTTLHYARCFLREKATTPLVVSGGINRLHLIEELQEYCKPGYLLYQCSFSDLVDLVHNIYTTYGTTEAATFTQHHDSTVGGAFFNSHMRGTHQLLLPHCLQHPPNHLHLSLMTASHFSTPVTQTKSTLPMIATPWETLPQWLAVTLPPWMNDPGVTHYFITTLSFIVICCISMSLTRVYMMGILVILSKLFTGSVSIFSVSGSIIMAMSCFNKLGTSGGTSPQQHDQQSCSITWLIHLDWLATFTNGTYFKNI
ncbi:uncharacterized protein EI90DRAFT_3020036 [Cantharellus anzutake]|uniref:uncharacterized protein n=1 Tax=Cantharellus anzutake TaxID=1750568 RepID=UPI001904C5CF|nr:uncharacterized protein EI90DRAFT_3020036 [Cantharellus anzutake]KAF8322770.1 hypothetical protein EI90DRAFT_3020036 [Cantharellus anzutake]